MKRLALCLLLIGAQDPEKLLADAEKERSGALYEQAMKAFEAALEANPKNAAAHEGRAIARWRLSLMRGGVDPEVAVSLAAAGDRPRAKALQARVKLVDDALTGGGWGHLPEAILKQVVAKAFPDSAPLEAPMLKHPAELPSDWPFPAPQAKEGMLSILAALRLPPADGLKALEAAEGPDLGLLMQAQAWFLAAEGRFTEATGRMSIAPLPVLRAAAHVAAGRSAPALESLGTETSAFAGALRAVALMQAGTDAAIAEMDKLVDSIPIAWFRVERGIRRLARGDSAGAAADLKGSREYPLALWHAQDFEGAARELSALTDRTSAQEETLGYVLQAKGDQEGGAARLIAALEKSPTREAFFRLARHLRGDRQWQALRELGRVLAKSAEAEPEAWAAQAEAAFWLKTYDASIATVTAALEKKIDPRKLLKWRAHSWEELGKYAEAHEDWSRLAELDDQQEGEALSHRAWMRARLGRWADLQQDAETGISRARDAWSSAVARFALAADELHGPAPEGEEIDAESRAEGAMKHLLLAAKTGAVEASDLEKVRTIFAPVGEENWKKVADAAEEKRKELKDDAKRSSMLGIMADHGGGSVMVTGTYRKSGARRVGLAPGDIVLEVEGRRVIHVGDVGSILSGREPGTQVKVKIERELRPKLKLVQVRTVTLTNRDLFGE